MQITRAILDEATAGGILGRDQGHALWSWLEERDLGTPSFRPAHILYYLGGLVAIGAMTLFMTLGWERFGGRGLLVIAVAYAAIAIAVTERLVRRPHLVLPAGIIGALAVAVVPLAVYGLQQVLGLWPAHAPTSGYRDYHTRIDWRWLLMELATLSAGCVASWRWRQPFGMLPVAVTLWYMSMDLTPFLFGGEPQFFSQRACLVSACFGLATTLLAFMVDLRSARSKDHAFWLYVFGVMTFWGGLTNLDSNSELGKLAYCGINLAMIAIGAALSRRVFALFGGIGVALYLGHLSHTVFKDSMLFPVALTAIGLLVVAAGVAWQRHEAALGERLRARLPRAVRELVELRAS